MGTLPRVLVILAVWLLYVLLLTRSCSDTLCEGCGGAAAPVPVGMVAEDCPPLYTSLDEGMVVAGGGFEDFRSELRQGRTSDNVLEITGYYYEDEEAPDGYINLGFARAEEARQLIASDLPESRVLKKARLLLGEPDEPATCFDAVRVAWLEAGNTAASSLERLEDRIHIRFPLGSDERDFDPAVTDYLAELAEQLQQSDVRVLLIGHTDNTGSTERNEALGLQRAERVREELIGLGVSSEQIEVQSRGARQPIATNDNERGRHENRRVEIRNLP